MKLAQALGAHTVAFTTSQTKRADAAALPNVKTAISLRLLVYTIKQGTAALGTKSLVEAVKA